MLVGGAGEGQSGCEAQGRLLCGGLMEISERIPVWAVLTTALADGSNPKYPAKEKHALLVMVRATESDVPLAVDALLTAKGWRDVAMERFKLLKEPFHSDDPVTMSCYEGAMTSEGGIVVYEEPIEEGAS
jgi:hypothetical protein